MVATPNYKAAVRWWNFEMSFGASRAPAASRYSEAKFCHVGLMDHGFMQLSWTDCNGFDATGEG